MFIKGSRYEKAGTATAAKLDGTLVAVTRIPLPTSLSLIGFHRQREGKSAGPDRCPVPGRCHRILAFV